MSKLVLWVAVSAIVVVAVMAGTYLLTEYVAWIARRQGRPKIKVTEDWSRYEPPER